VWCHRVLFSSQVLFFLYIPSSERLHTSSGWTFLSRPSLTSHIKLLLNIYNRENISPHIQRRQNLKPHIMFIWLWEGCINVKQKYEWSKSFWRGCEMLCNLFYFNHRKWFKNHDVSEVDSSSIFRWQEFKNLNLLPPPFQASLRSEQIRPLSSCHLKTKEERASKSEVF
jgi:hypothetical protein